MTKRPKPGQLGLETTYQVRTRDSELALSEYEKLPKSPIVLVLDNIRSAFNVGALFRTADTARIAQIITCGYTAHPPHAKLDKTALGTTAVIPTRHVSSVLEALEQLHRENIPVFALETTAQSENYTKVVFPEPVALVLGNEVEGVLPETLNHCDRVIEIPLHGFKNSLNVASAGAVVIFEILRQRAARAD